MHCEEAPCETVCPVGATVHDSEGLNVMVYNRCIGTRFCSNNCPYMVRRFNYFAFSNEEQRPPEARNPDVTVRGRGVMEKCTFCLQRIAEARIAADQENRPVGEVRTACQAACPTQAFTFGNMADRTARSPSANRARSIMRCWRTRTRVRASPTRRASATRNSPMRAAADDRHSGLTRTASRESHRRFAPAAFARPSCAAGFHHRFDDRPDMRDRTARTGLFVVVDRDDSGLAFHRRTGRRNPLAVLRGRRHLGHRLAGGLGVCDHQLCLVDRDRVGGNVHLRAFLSDRGGVANLAEPERRDDDGVRGRLRGDLSDPASGAAMVILLAISFPQYDDLMAAVSKPAAVGFFCDLHLRHLLHPVLVSWPRSRSRDDA